MSFILYLGKVITPTILTIAVIYGLIEKKNVFELFLKGIVDGEKIIIKLFPTLLALLVAVGMLNSSGVIEFISKKIIDIFPFIKVYKELLPFILLRPISGSTSSAIGTDLMQKFGVDSSLGILVSLIMGSTETTIYVVSVYGSKIGKKNMKPVLILGLLGDLICVLSSILYFNLFY